MKWNSINIGSLLNHKLLFNHIPEDDDEHGVSGICISDVAFFGEKINMECGGVPFEFCGSSSSKDNLICSNEHIKIELDNVKKIVFLGFNEFGNYGDKLTVVEKNKRTHIKQIFFYGLNQSVETLYSSEMNEYCSEAVKTTANEYLAVNFYKCEIPIDGLDIEEIILPDNIEMHILAVSVLNA